MEPPPNGPQGLREPETPEQLLARLVSELELSNRRLRTLEQIVENARTTGQQPQAPPVVQPTLETEPMMTSPPLPTPATSNSSAVRYSHPKSRLPDPKEFDGEDLAQFPAFQQKLRAKLVVDGLALGDTVDQAYYVYGRLSGKAANRLLPWIQTTESVRPGSLNVENIMEQLEKAFSDPNLRTKAISRLSILRQKSRDIGEFLAEFEQYVIQAGGILWSDDVKIGYLYNALNPRLLQGLVGTAPSTSYEHFCSTLRLIEDQINRAQRAANRTTFNRSQTVPAASSSTTVRSGTVPMDWEPTKVGAVQQGANPSRKRAIRVSTQEIERRRTNQLCIRCGGKGHFINKCELLPPERIDRTRPSPPATRVAAVEEVEDVSDDDLKSGKD